MKTLGRALLSLILFFALMSGGVQWLSALQFRRGRDAYERGDFYAALAAFKSSAEFFSRDPETHRYLAKSYLRLLPSRNEQGRLNLLRKAEIELLAALDIEPDYPYYWALLGRVSELLTNAGAAPKKSAYACYQQAVRLDPNNPLMLELFSKYLIKAGLAAQAQPLIRKLVKISLTSSREIARLWLKKGEDPMDLIPLFAGSNPALAELREVFQAARLHQAELRVGEEALAHAPNDPEAIMIYALSFGETGDCEKIRIALAPIMDTPDYEEPARRLYAHCLVRAKQYEGAEKEYLRLISLEPDSIEYRWALANNYLNRKQPVLAKEQLLWLVKNPSLGDRNLKAQSLLKLAQICEKENQPEQAAKYYELYLEFRPEDQRVKNKLEQVQTNKSRAIIYSPWGEKHE